MNIAFPALLLFLLLLPGFIFRASFKSLEGVPLDGGPFASGSIKSIIVALAFNLLGWCVVDQFTQYEVRWDALLSLLVGDKARDLDKAIALVSKAPVAHVQYFLGVYFGSWASGILFRSAIVRWKLDKRSHPLSGLFRLRAPWYYIFKGYDTDSGKEPDVIYVTTIVSLAEPYLFRGVLVDFQLSSNGGLETITLSAASRRKLSQDRESKGKGDGGGNPNFYAIDGDYFVLQRSEMITLNVFYLFAQVSSPDTQGMASGDGAKASS